MNNSGNVYEVAVTYTVEVTDRSALLSAAFDRFAAKLSSTRSTGWQLEQWQGWVRDGTADPGTLTPRGVDVALFEFLDEHGQLMPMDGARMVGWSSQQRLRPEWPPIGTEDLPPSS
jgi:hypothetical protein